MSSKNEAKNLREMSKKVHAYIPALISIEYLRK